MNDYINASPEGAGNSRPISSVSTRIPSQAGIRAAFSRPITAANNENDVSREKVSPIGTEYTDEAIDQVLITQIEEALDDSPLLNYIRFRRCEDDFDDVPNYKTPDIFDAEEWDTDLDSDADDDEESADPTFRRLYLQICQRLAVVPISYFMKHIEDGSVSLKYHGVTSSETSAISQALKKILKIERLDLEGNYMTSRGCRYLCETLESNQTIRELNIAENKLNDSCVERITAMLANNGTLKKLSLAGNAFTDNSAYAFAECMEDCKLIALDLSQNKFGERGGVILGPALSTNVYMDILRLSWNHIRGAGALAIAKGLKENVRLSVCDLSWNGFCEPGGMALADALLVNTNLKEIDISSNRLTYPVALRLAKALSSNEVLEVLKMANNPITTSGCLALIEVVCKSNTSSVHYLDLYENPVEYEFLRVAKDVLHKKPNFQVFHGPILRAGNTSQDIGKPAIDIVRLSQQPVMLLKGQIVINNMAKLRECLTKRGVKSDYCTADKLLLCFEDLDNKLNKNAMTEALMKVQRDDRDRICISDLLG